MVARAQEGCLGLSLRPSYSAPLTPVSRGSDFARGMRLKTFGGLALEDNGAPASGAALQRKRLGLLAFLAAESPAAVSRDKLVALFWPDSAAERARGALYQTLSVLRAVIGHDGIASGSAGDVRLDSAIVASDIVEFRAALGRGDLEAAAAAYSGPFLDGIFLRDAPEFERWVESTRAQLANSYCNALERLSIAAEARGDTAAAMTFSRRLAEADPLSSRAALRYMRSLARCGEREAAVRHGRIHQSLVRAELGGHVDPTVASFIEELLTTPTNGALVHDTSPNVTVLSAPSGERHADQRVSHTPTAADTPEERQSPFKSSRTKMWLMFVALGVVLLIGLPAGALLWRRSADDPTIANSHRVVVDEFDNRTGDTTLAPLGAMLADWVTRGLQQTGVVDVVDPESRLAAARRLASQSGSLSGRQRAVAVAREAGAGTVVSGAIYRQAGVLRYSALITEVGAGRVLASLDPVETPNDDPVGGAEQLRERVAGALAVALDARMPSVSGPGNRPPSFPAYREFMRGMEAFQPEYYQIALQHFESAARLDTTFSTPLVWALFAVTNGAGNASTGDSLRDALAGRKDRLAPLDRLALEWFQFEALGDDANADEALNAAARLSPESAWGFMAGQTAVSRNRPAEALQFLQRLDPVRGWVGGWWLYWKALANAQHLLGRYEEELGAARMGRRLGALPIAMDLYELRALAALGRTQDVLHLLDVPPTTDVINNEPLWKAGLELRVHGHINEARAAFERSLAWYRSSDVEAWVRADTTAAAERRRQLQIWIGKQLYELGRWDEARLALDGVQERTLSDVAFRAQRRAILGLIAAHRGERAVALASRTYVDSVVTLKKASEWTLLASAEISEILGDRDRAISRLEALPSQYSDTQYQDLHRAFEMKALRTDPRFVAIARPKE